MARTAAIGRIARTNSAAIPQKQNLITRSKNAAHSDWTKLGLNATTPIVSNATVAPDGTTTADQIVEGTGTGLHIIYRNTGATVAPGFYTISASLKQGARRYGGMQIIVGSALLRYFVLVDLQTGTVVSTNTTGAITGTGYSVTSQGNGWYRLSVTAFSPDVGAVNICVSPSDTASPSYSASFPSYAGDNASGIYATDYQVVATNWPGPVASTVASVVNTGNLRRLVPQTQNLISTSEPSSLSDIYSRLNVSVSAFAWPAAIGATNAVVFGDNSLTRAAYQPYAAMRDGDIVTFSVFIQMDDASAPVCSSSGSGSDCMMVFSSNAVATTPVLVSGSTYRITYTGTATVAGNLFGVVKYGTNSSKTFKVTGYHLSRSGRYVPYAKTLGVAYDIGAPRNTP